MAIARHSLKNHRSDLMFKGVLTGVCALTTLIIFAESIWGINRLGIMKWAALAVSITSITLFLRACQNAKKLLNVKKSPESKSTEEDDQPVSGDQLISKAESPTAVNASGNWQEPLSAEADELQLREAQLQQNARVPHDQTASVSEGEDQSEGSEFDPDVDQ